MNKSAMSDEANKDHQREDEDEDEGEEEETVNVTVRSVRFHAEPDNNNNCNTGSNYNSERSNNTEETSDRSSSATTAKPPREIKYSKWFLRCPRCWAVILGMLVPLWLLIGISFGFGYGLAKVESTPELERNDDILKEKAIAALRTSAFFNFTESLPSMCLEAKLTNQTIADVAYAKLGEFFEVDDAGIMMIAPGGGDSFPTTATTTTPRSSTTDYTDMVFNYTDLVQFLQDCSDSAKTYVASMMESTTTAGSVLTQSLTFNWNRCPFELNSTDNNVLDNFLQGSVIFQGASTQFRKTLAPSAQTNQYSDLWTKHATKLYTEKINQTDFTGMNVTEVVEAKYDYFLEAIDEATGRDGCAPNTVASVWFWFTIMTTMGYGNQIPTTWQGRTLVFTVGFLNILLFGAVAASSGYMLSAIANDLASRRGIPIESKPWIACVFWAVLLYAWMLLIAFVYQDWKEARLNTKVAAQDAYWFAFMSTSTVGLGDYYLEPEVLVFQDLLTFPVLFLMSFTFFGSFLANLGTVVMKPLEGRTSFVDVLKSSGVLQSEDSIREYKQAAKQKKQINTVSSDSSEDDEPRQQGQASATIATGAWHPTEEVKGVELP